MKIEIENIRNNLGRKFCVVKMSDDTRRDFVVQELCDYLRPENEDFLTCCDAENRDSVTTFRFMSGGYVSLDEIVSKNNKSVGADMALDLIMQIAEKLARASGDNGSFCAGNLSFKSVFVSEEAFRRSKISGKSDVKMLPPIPYAILAKFVNPDKLSAVSDLYDDPMDILSPGSDIFALSNMMITLMNGEARGLPEHIQNVLSHATSKITSFRYTSFSKFLKDLDVKPEKKSYGEISSQFYDSFSDFFSKIKTRGASMNIRKKISEKITEREDKKSAYFTRVKNEKSDDTIYNPTAVPDASGKTNGADEDRTRSYQKKTF